MESKNKEPKDWIKKVSKDELLTELDLQIGGYMNFNKLSKRELNRRLKFKCNHNPEDHDHPTGKDLQRLQKWTWTLATAIADGVCTLIRQKYRGSCV